MVRFCPNCQKDIDFPVKSIRDLDSLICPECGCKVEKNSRNPDLVNNDDNIESGIGNAFAVFFRIMYLFYFLFAFPSLFFYYFSLSRLLFIFTAINVVFYLLQLVFWGGRFAAGVILIPIGAVVSFFVLRTFMGVCLGIQIVFLAYFLIRGLFYDILFGIIRRIT